MNKLLIGKEVYTIEPKEPCATYDKPVSITVGSKEDVKKGYWVRSETNGQPYFVSYKKLEQYLNDYVASLTPAPVVQAAPQESKELEELRARNDFLEKQNKEFLKKQVIASLPVGSPNGPKFAVGDRVWGTIFNGNNVPGEVVEYSPNYYHRGEHQPYKIKTTQGRFMTFSEENLRHA